MYSLSQYVEIPRIGVSVLRNQETSKIKMLFIGLIFPECVVPLKNGKGVSESLWKCCDFLVRKGERTLSKKPRISSHWILLPTSATRTSQAHLRRTMGSSLWARVLAKQQCNMCWHTGSETYLSPCNWDGKTTKKLGLRPALFNHGFLVVADDASLPSNVALLNLLT